MEGGGVWRVTAAAVVAAAVVAAAVAAAAVVAAALRWNSRMLRVKNSETHVRRRPQGRCPVSYISILVTKVTTLFCLFMLDPVV